MFGINFSEIILILIISLIIFDPRQLPEIASKIGKIIFSTQHFFIKIKQDMYRHSGFNEFNQTKQDVTHLYHQIKNTIITNPTCIDNETGKFHPDVHLYQAELEFDRQPELFDQ